MAKTLISAGIVLFLAGLVWHFSGGRIPLGRLPGDIRIERAGGGFYFPVVTCLLLSGIFSLVTYLFRK